MYVYYQLRELLFLLTLCLTVQKTVAHLRHMRPLAKSNTDFALEFYGVVKNIVPKHNFVFSPVGLALSMSLLHLGSSSNTKKQISQVFHFGNDNNYTETLYTHYKQLQSIFKHPFNNYTLDIHNRLYGNSGYKYKSTFINNSLEYFDAILEEVDFINKADDVRCKINTWVANVTSQRINHLLHASFLSPSTVLFMLNVIYFNGIWKHPFDYHHTTKGKFYITRDKVVEMDMMKTKQYLRYADVSERYRYRILEIPYTGEKISMYILLPDLMSDLGYVESHLTSVDFQDVLQNKMRKYQVDVSIPRFQIRQHLNLRSILSKMGITDLFLPGASDLSGIAENTDIYLMEFIHSIFLQVNEIGTEAASISGFKVGLTSLVQEPEFRVNRPFLFIIREKITGFIIFIGRLVKPPNYVPEVGIFADGRFDRNGASQLNCKISFVVGITLLSFFFVANYVNKSHRQAVHQKYNNNNQLGYI